MFLYLFIFVEILSPQWKKYSNLVFDTQFLNTNGATEKVCREGGLTIKTSTLFERETTKKNGRPDIVNRSLKYLRLASSSPCTDIIHVRLFRQYEPLGEAKRALARPRVLQSERRQNPKPASRRSINNLVDILIKYCYNNIHTLFNLQLSHSFWAKGNTSLKLLSKLEHHMS